jgi:large subunit ribosomal protein L35
MPKMKSCSAAKKRFRLTGTKKVKRSKANTSHILTKKRPKRKRHLRTATTASSVDEKRLRRLLQG